MKTAIIDRTLSFFRPVKNIKPAEAKAYADSVFVCGADYIELDRYSAAALEKEPLSEKFILRIKETDDIEYCSGHSFAYVCLPFCMAGYIDKIPQEQPVIIEVSADEYSAQPILMYINRFAFTRRVSMIRLTGVFGDDDDSVGELVRWYKSNYFIPLDICPLNTMMTGVSDALSAYMAGVNAVTLSFGRGYYYSALEQFIINVHIYSKTGMSTDTIKGICAASLIFTSVFGAVPTGLEHIIDTDSELTSAIHDIENGIVYKSVRLSGSSFGSVNNEGIIERKIKSIGLEREIEDAIIEMIKKVDFRFYKDITKRNII